MDTNITVPGKLSWSAKSLYTGFSILLVGADFTACGDSDSEASGENPINVVASTTQICDYMKQLDIDKVGLTCLLAPSATAHKLEMIHKQLIKTGNADLLFASGVNLEHLLDQAIESLGFSGAMIVTSSVLTAGNVDAVKTVKDTDKTKPLPPEKTKNGNYTIDRGMEKIDVAPWPFPPEEPGEEAEFRFGPHVWASPKNAKIQVASIDYALEKVAEKRGDNELKSTIVDRVAVYQDKLGQLGQWASKSIVTVSDPALSTSHDVFGYFFHGFNINFIDTALFNFDEQQDVTATYIAEAAKTVKDSGATALFVGDPNSSKSIKTTIRITGVRAIVGEDTPCDDSPGPASSDGETYTGSIVHSIAQIVTA